MNADSPRPRPVPGKTHQIGFAVVWQRRNQTKVCFTFRPPPQPVDDKVRRSADFDLQQQHAKCGFRPARRPWLQPGARKPDAVPGAWLLYRIDRAIPLAMLSATASAMISVETDEAEPIATQHGAPWTRAETKPDAAFLFALYESVKGPELATPGMAAGVKVRRLVQAARGVGRRPPPARKRRR
jgi:hypothetical protein